MMILQTTTNIFPGKQPAWRRTVLGFKRNMMKSAEPKEEASQNEKYL